LIWLLASIQIIPDYHYQSSDGRIEFYECPDKGRPFDVVEAEFQRYVANHPDIELRRTTSIPWWSPGEWYDILTHQRWEYEYMPPSESAISIWEYEQSSDEGG
jgi:hypothetical protein